MFPNFYFILLHNNLCTLKRLNKFLWFGNYKIFWKVWWWCCASMEKHLTGSSRSCLNFLRRDFCLESESRNLIKRIWIWSFKTHCESLIKQIWQSFHVKCLIERWNFLQSRRHNAQVTTKLAHHCRYLLGVAQNFHGLSVRIVPDHERALDCLSKSSHFLFRLVKRVGVIICVLIRRNDAFFVASYIRIKFPNLVRWCNCMLQLSNRRKQSGTVDFEGSVELFAQAKFNSEEVKLKRESKLSWD